MYLKICPKCNEKSYSASKINDWICPICDEDITEVEASLTDERDGDE